MKRSPWIFLWLALAGAFLWWGIRERRQHRDSRYDRQIRAAAQRYGVAPALIKAVVWRESSFDARARGGAGEIGLMQVREPAAFEWAQAEKLEGFAHEQLFDPGRNILAGTWYLRRVMSRYRATDDPVPYALADYNAGRSNVLRWNKGSAASNHLAFIEQITYPTTRAYVVAVRRRAAHYQREFPAGHTDADPRATNPGIKR